MANVQHQLGLWVSFAVLLTELAIAMSRVTPLTVKYMPAMNRVSVPTVNLSCGSNNRVCSGAYIAYKCNVTSTALVWKIIGPEPAEITLTQFDKIGTNIKYLDLIVAVVNVTTMAQPFLASEIEFFASEKYNNTKFYCADGVKGENSTFFCSPKLFSFPEPVVNLRSRATVYQNEDVLELSWDAAKTLEADIMHYTIQVNPVPGDGTCATGVCNTTDNKFTITKLNDCVNYDIKVQAVNCAGVGNATHLFIQYDVPDAVENLRTSNEDRNSICVKWNSPQNTGGKAIDSYIVSVTPAPQTGSCPDGECLVANTSLVLTGLKPCEAYTVDVKALNCRGIGPTVSAQVTTDAGLMFGITSLHKVIMSCNDTLDVYYEWAGCSDLNVTFLVVFADEKNSLSQNYEKTMLLQHAMKGNLSFPISFNLEDKAEYFFSIGAYNLSKPLTDVKIGYLSSTRMCANGQDVGISEKTWKLSFIITTPILVVICFSTVTVLLIISCRLCFKHMQRKPNCSA